MAVGLALVQPGVVPLPYFSTNLDGTVNCNITGTPQMLIQSSLQMLGGSIWAQLMSRSLL